MGNYIKKLLNVIIFFTIAIGIPYLIHDWTFLLISWFPANVVMDYLDED